MEFLIAAHRTTSFAVGLFVTRCCFLYYLSKLVNNKYVGVFGQRRMRGTGTRNAERETGAEAGFNPVFRARPPKRTIQQQDETPLAHEIVAGRCGPGDAILVDSQGDALESMLCWNRIRCHPST
jgi:hypothetical protein